MDKYDVIHDHYCYSGSSTLKNKLNIKNIELLEEAEREITAITIKNIRFFLPPYNLDYLCYIHYQLFSELYDWAGKIRTIDISKGGTRFCTNTRIAIEVNKLFLQLEKENWLINLKRHDFCKKLAEYYIEFNMIHPFREGNGRVQRLFFEHLSLAAGYDLNWKNIEPEEWIQANIDGVNINYVPMEKIFSRIITFPKN